MKEEYIHNTNEAHEPNKSINMGNTKEKLETTGKRTLKAHKNTKKQKRWGLSVSLGPFIVMSLRPQHLKL
jgi:hypothetical protein